VLKSIYCLYGSRTIPSLPLQCHSKPFVAGPGASAIKTKRIQYISLSERATVNVILSEDGGTQTQVTEPVLMSRTSAYSLH
jgi:hypothetical protein